MEKHFNPQQIEQKWYPIWENAGFFKATIPQGDQAAYCIMLPPPNVTGSLHMGHAFQDTLMDTLIRYHRMQGAATLWQPGTDHAGIATQMVVERQLEAKGMSRHDLGREAFLEKVWQWKEESGGTITRQLRRLGASCDWSRERFTMDEGLSEAVREVFVRLYEEGLIYRGKRLVNWDPVLHTAVSDLEVISEEEQGHLWHMRYPLASGDGHLVVATTRPETMLGDMAVAVHPEDERYQHLIGQKVILPLVEREIPIVADTYVDPEFGTGCVKITPAHDFNDYEMGKRHKLPLLNVFTEDAHILAEPWMDFSLTQTPDKAPEAAFIPEKYHGLDRYEARKRIVADLQEIGLIEKIEDHKLMVPRGDRSGAVIEPFLTDQWYVKVAPLAEPAIAAVKNGDIQFVPKNWENTYFEWMNNIQDWCISRQLWWGHRIPAWYDAEGHVYVGRSEEEVRQKHQIPADVKLHQDEDVLDTWFSSALWPFTTLGWPEKTPELAAFYPTSVLVTGFDIIFFWVARMIMMGLKFMGDVPFKQVYVHGLVRDAEGQKMSKSKGNVLDPLDLIDGIDLESLVKKRTTGMMQPQKAKAIEKATRRQFPEGIPAFGTDALRFTFMSLASTGRDIRFDMNRAEGYRNYCNKIWNASRFVLMNTQGQDTGLEADAPLALSMADKWIISRLQILEAEVAKDFQQYRFDLMAKKLYEFTWGDYCDWYLEEAKILLNDPQTTEAQARGTRRTLVRVLEALLRLQHPVMPFITEEIWQQIKALAGKTGESISLAPYPQADESKIDQSALEDQAWLQSFVVGIRQIRSQMDIAPGKALPVILANFTQQDQARLKAYQSLLIKLARLESIELAAEEDPAIEAAVALVGQMKVLIPMAGLIDKAAELNRLSKAMEKLQGEIKRLQAKLSNENFISRAPAAVVEKEKTKLAAAEQQLNQLSGEYEKISRL